jgi:hypothetical protein
LYLFKMSFLKLQIKTSDVLTVCVNQVDYDVFFSLLLMLLYILKIFHLF